MAMPGEMEYYSTYSGLPADASLNEHQRAFWAAQTGMPAEQAAATTHSELERLFYLVETLDSQPWYTLGDLRYRYFLEKTGLPAGLTVSDYMAAFFANPPLP